MGHHWKKELAAPSRKALLSQRIARAESLPSRLLTATPDAPLLSHRHMLKNSTDWWRSFPLPQREGRENFSRIASRPCRRIWKPPRKNSVSLPAIIPRLISKSRAKPWSTLRPHSRDNSSPRNRSLRG